jgi:hypothetical protein
MSIDVQQRESAALLVSAGHSQAATSQPLSARGAAFTRATDKLWEDHVTWTLAQFPDKF